ncbi:hypothetical protein PMI29_03314 [Pseudomonas sp. GM49]|uniref:hypothetical protein n=1 Tax=Pseudomonas sp. GM49 TaxID=1144331 RepID=UPI00027016EB|nr:hypothetical protein [Pseudomonas sp. GM49]EJM63831.1 hypothetical protein PMI29_03314 [Pseudomonas sp. GM49]
MKDLTGDERTLWGFCFTRSMIRDVRESTSQGEVEFAADSAVSAANALILVRRSRSNVARDSFEQRLWDDYAGEAMVKFSEVRYKLDNNVALAGKIAKQIETGLMKYRGVEEENLPSFPFGN